MSGKVNSKVGPSAAEAWAAFLADRSPENRWRVVECYLPVVRLLADKHAARLATAVGTEADDLYQVGVIGLMEAVKAFDPGRAVQFTTFAPRRINGAMMDSLRGLDWNSRLNRAAGDRRSMQPMSRELYGNPDGRRATVLGDVLRDRRAVDPAAAAAGPEGLRAMVRELPRAHKLLVLLVDGEGLTLKEAGLAVGFSESRASQLRTEAFGMLRARLTRKAG